MSRYLVAVCRPNDYDHAALVADGAHRDIDTLNKEMNVAGVVIFVGGLRPISDSRSLHPESDNNIRLNEGSCLVAENYVDGFWVLECTDMDEAIDWGRRAALACRASVEIRPFYP